MKIFSTTHFKLDLLKAISYFTDWSVVIFLLLTGCTVNSLQPYWNSQGYNAISNFCQWFWKLTKLVSANADNNKLF